MDGGHFSKSCSPDILAKFHKTVKGQIWKVNMLLLVNVVLAGVIVGIGAYGHRYRHHPLTRFIFLGATTLFLPIISYIVSTLSGVSGTSEVISIVIYQTHGPSEQLTAECYTIFHSYAVILCAFLVLIAAINSSTIVAADDREGRNIGPPFDLLVQGAWTFYLCVSTNERNARSLPNELGLDSGDSDTVDQFERRARAYTQLNIFFILICAKLVFKYYAFEKRTFTVDHTTHGKGLV
ncbi:hypothetical protein ACP70R_014546 [Stipagrostis hirtigluma subsp. patula]